MKLFVCDKHRYDAWLLESRDDPNSGYESPLNLDRLQRNPLTEAKQTVEVLPEANIGELTCSLSGASSIISRFGLRTWCLYCPQATGTALDKSEWNAISHRISRSQVTVSALNPKKKLADYDIQDGDLLLLEKLHDESDVPFNGTIFPCLKSVPSATYFFDIVCTRESIEPKRSRGWLDKPWLTDATTQKAILLYTDEDASLGEFVRCNYHTLDKLTSYTVDLFVIEQPARSNGVSAREYWKSRLSTSLYAILHQIGATRYKPYDKAEAYVIAERLGLLPEQLPCIVLFRDINNEKIVLTLSEGECEHPTDFFRRFVSTVKRSEKIVTDCKKAQVVKPEYVSSATRIRRVQALNSIPDERERIEAKNKVYNEWKKAGNEEKERAFEKAQGEASRVTAEDFPAFRAEFLKAWEDGERSRFVDIPSSVPSSHSLFLPSGTVTFLFTDIEGSTKLWEAYPQTMQIALARHDELMRQAMEDNNGVVFKTVGDAFCTAFATAPDAINAALAAQVSLVTEPWPDDCSLRVRMALHAGVAQLRDNDYFGQSLNRIARLLALGHGGQVLLSRVTHDLIRDTLPPSASLKPLGEYRLRSLSRPEAVFQLLHPDLPSKFPSLSNAGKS